MDHGSPIAAKYSTADKWCRAGCRLVARLKNPDISRNVVNQQKEIFVKMHDRSQLLTPGEVALMFRVDPKTVTRWASSGRIGSVRTPGGHRRFLEADIKLLLDQLTTEAGPPMVSAGSNEPSSSSSTRYSD